MRVSLIVTALAIALPNAAHAGTAICRNISGLIVDQKPDGSLQSNEDGFRNAVWVLQWDRTDTGVVITEPTHDMIDTSPSTNTALVIHSKGFVTFIETYPKAVRIYTLYPDSKKLLFTMHSDSELAKNRLGEGPSYLSGNIMTGDCTVQ